MSTTGGNSSIDLNMKTMSFSSDNRTNMLSLQIYSERNSRLHKVLKSRLASSGCFKEVVSIDSLEQLDNSTSSILLLMDCISFLTISRASEISRRRGKRLGILLGDVSQYLQDIYKYYLRLVDFVVCEDPGEASLIEFSYGVPSFYHPFIQPKTLSRPDEFSAFEESGRREFDFVHLGLVDEFRLGRTDLRDNLKSLGSSYVLYGSGHRECIRLPWEEVHIKLERCTFGLVACAAYTSDPLSRPKEATRYQLKGKIWEYMLAGCIPVVDYLPGASTVGLQEGVDFLQLGKFTQESLSSILVLNSSIVANTSSKVREKANSIVFGPSGVGEFRDFLLRVLDMSIPDRYLPAGTRLSKACEQYTFKQKRFTQDIFLSWFYLIKLFNYCRRLLRRLERGV